MRQETLALLQCPNGCGTALDLTAQEMSGGRVISGLLTCGKCARSFPIVESIARLLPSALTDAQADWMDAKEAAQKKSEMTARDEQVGAYDRMKNLALFGKIEIPVTLRMLQPQRTDVLLEAGCGTGRMTPTFARRVSSLVAVDFSFESLRVCRGKLDAVGITNVDLVQADVCALPFGSEQFHRVVSCQVLEHIPTPDSRSRMVAELARTVKFKGRVVLSAYQHSVLTRLFGQKEGQHAGGIYFYRFARRELRDLLGKSLRVRGMTGALIYHYLARCDKEA
jgi:ubiquinone/menaquinone biosynthesis C-methylase UbiE/uncharacterized protein YbaR (Trm112 family)